MSTLAVMFVALASVYGLFRFFLDARSFYYSLILMAEPKTRTKQTQGPTTYTRKNAQKTYKVLNEHEFGAWGEI